MSGFDAVVSAFGPTSSDPRYSSRLSGTDLDDYVRILKGATGHIFAAHDLPEPPMIEQVQRVVDNIEE
jgi:hypothetical protein